eukprot:4049485-Pyramimonas_sp.AAC.1
MAPRSTCGKDSNPCREAANEVSIVGNCTLAHAGTTTNETSTACTYLRYIVFPIHIRVHLSQAIVEQHYNMASTT